MVNDACWFTIDRYIHDLNSGWNRERDLGFSCGLSVGWVGLWSRLVLG